MIFYKKSFNISYSSIFDELLFHLFILQINNVFPKKANILIFIQ